MTDEEYEEEFDDPEYDDDLDDDLQEDRTRRSDVSRIRKLRHKFRKSMEVRKLVKAQDRKSKRADSKAKQKAPKLTANQKMMVTFLVTIVVLTVAASFFRDKFRTFTAPEPIATEYEFVLEEASVEELVTYAEGLERAESKKNPGDATDLPSRVKFLNKQIEIATRIEDLESKSEGSLHHGMVLRRLGLIASLNRLHNQHGLGKLDAKHIAYTLAHANHPDSDIRKAANLSICYNSVDEFLQNPSPENFKDTRNQFEISVDEFIDDKNLLVQFARLVKLIDPNQGNITQRQELFQILARRIRESKVPGSRQIADELMEYPILGDFNFERVTIDSELNDPEAISKGLGLVNEIAQSSEYGKDAHIFAVYILEMFERQGRHQKIATAKQRLIDNVSQVADHAKIVVQKYAQRTNLLGNTFDVTKFSEATTNEKTQCKLVVFYDLTYHSRQALDSVRNLPSKFKRDGLKTILVYYVPNADDSLLPPIKSGFNQKQVHLAFPECIHVDGTNADIALKSCPVQQGPYAILLDSKNQVVATNLSKDKIRTVINKQLYESNIAND